MRRKTYYVYMMASYSGTLYVGVTNNIVRRSWEHKMELVDGFSKRYHCTRLVHYEEFGDIRDAIKREKQIKSFSRKKKEALIKASNPEWKELLPDPLMQKGEDIVRLASRLREKIK